MFWKLFLDSAAQLSPVWMPFLYKTSYRTTPTICSCLEMPQPTVSLRMGFLSSLDKNDTNVFMVTLGFTVLPQYHLRFHLSVPSKKGMRAHIAEEWAFRSWFSPLLSCSFPHSAFRCLQLDSAAGESRAPSKPISSGSGIHLQWQPELVGGGFLCPEELQWRYPNLVLPPLSLPSPVLFTSVIAFRLNARSMVIRN